MTQLMTLNQNKNRSLHHIRRANQHGKLWVPALLTYHRLLTLIKRWIFIVFSAALSMNFGIEFHLYMDHDIDNCEQ